MTPATPSLQISLRVGRGMKSFGTWQDTSRRICSSTTHTFGLRRSDARSRPSRASPKWTRIPVNQELRTPVRAPSHKISYKPDSSTRFLGEGAACKCLIYLAPQVGLEPTTLRLTAECSTIELLRSNRWAHTITAKAVGPVNLLPRRIVRARRSVLAPSGPSYTAHRDLTEPRAASRDTSEENAVGQAVAFQQAAPWSPALSGQSPSGIHLQERTPLVQTF